MTITTEQLAALEAAHKDFFERGITSGRLPELLSAYPALIAAAKERDAAFAAGRKAGVEEAAKVADDLDTDNLPGSCDRADDPPAAGAVVACERIAAAIRALIEEEKTDG